MKIKLPCRLGEVFETAPDAMGNTQRLRLIGFNRGMRREGKYREPDILAEPEHVHNRHPYVNYNQFLRTGLYAGVLEIEIPDVLLEEHLLAGDGIRSRRKGEMTGVTFCNGQVQFEYFMPDRALQPYTSPLLEQHIAAILPEPGQELDQQEQEDTAPKLDAGQTM